jgi:hypothetical protein
MTAMCAATGTEVAGLHERERFDSILSGSPEAILV